MKFKVKVSPYVVKRTGKPSKQRWVWAAFRTFHAASQYMDQLQRENPTWIIELDNGIPPGLPAREAA